MPPHPPLLPLRPTKPYLQLAQSFQSTRRSFVTNPLNLLPTTQSLHASLILPYRSSDLYTLIADIAAYPTFLPYCTSANITSWSAPHPRHSGKRYPRSATLGIGYKNYVESFHSRVFCAPDRVVEAVCGGAQTSIPDEELDHYKTLSSDVDPKQVHTEGQEIFESLLTRWTLRPFHYKPPPTVGRREEDGGELPRNAAEANPGKGEASPESEARTEVDLHIEVKFASPMYAALSQAAAPRVADVMVDAFERRAREVLGKGRG